MGPSGRETRTLRTCAGIRDYRIISLVSVTVFETEAYARSSKELLTDEERFFWLNTKTPVTSYPGLSCSCMLTRKTKRKI
jgi:hypothetical protein